MNMNASIQRPDGSGGRRLARRAFDGPRDVRAHGTPSLQLLEAQSPRTLTKPVAIGANGLERRGDRRRRIVDVDRTVRKRRPQDRPVRDDDRCALINRLVGPAKHGVIEVGQDKRHVGVRQQAGVRGNAQEPCQRQVGRPLIAQMGRQVLWIPGDEERDVRERTGRRKDLLDGLVVIEGAHDGHGETGRAREALDVLEQHRHVGDERDPGAGGPDERRDVLAVDERRRRPAAEPPLQPLQRAPARMEEGVGVRVEHHRLAPEPGVQESGERRDHRRRHHEDDVRPLTSEDAPGPEPLHRILQQDGRGAAAEFRRIHHVRDAAQLARRMIASAARFGPRDVGDDRARGGLRLRHVCGAYRGPDTPASAPEGVSDQGRWARVSASMPTRSTTS